MKLRYGLDDRPTTGETALQALQWLALSLPFVVIVGTVAAGHQSGDAALRTVYLQKTAFAAGLMLLAQATVGHRLTLVAGPATALLLGIVGSGATPDAIYTAAAVSGLILAALSAAGLFGLLRHLFTTRVTAAVVLLIGFTMTPTIVRLITGGSGSPVAGRIGFATALAAALFVAHRLLPAAGRSLLIVAGMAAGTALYLPLFGGAATGGGPAFAGFFGNFTAPVFDVGAIVSFLFCFLALSLNEIGSMQSVAPLLRPHGMEGRIRRGMTVAGLVNAAAGFLGVIGPVDFSLSPGVIAASGCGSRFPLIPAGLLVIAASFSPALLGLAGAIPAAVIGAVLVYALSGQIAAGMTAAFAGGTFTFEDGLVIALPLMAGTVTALLPAAAVAEFPPLLRSVAGNGFVVGVVAVLAMDQLFRRKT